MIDRMIVDADLCIKLGGSNKYKYLYDVLPMISENIYMHSYAKTEVMMPMSAVEQLQLLISEGKVILVDEEMLDEKERAVYDMTYALLERVMSDPRRPKKNKGEICALAYAKTVEIPVFATDERNLQPIIDRQLNVGVVDIKCVRIIDIIEKAKSGEIDIPRKVAKAMWVICGKNKEEFDKRIWKI